MRTINKPAGLWFHSPYKGSKIMRNCEESGYWAECKGVMASSSTLAGIRRLVTKLVDAPTISLARATGEQP